MPGSGILYCDDALAVVGSWGWASKRCQVGCGGCFWYWRGSRRGWFLKLPLDKAFGVLKCNRAHVLLPGGAVVVVHAFFAFV